jgi:hypothetical protein
MILNDFLILFSLIISSSVIKRSDGFDSQQVAAFQNVQLPQNNNIPGNYKQPKSKPGDDIKCSKEDMLC